MHELTPLPGSLPAALKRVQRRGSVRPEGFPADEQEAGEQRIQPGASQATPAGPTGRLMPDHPPHDASEGVASREGWSTGVVGGPSREGEWAMSRLQLSLRLLPTVAVFLFLIFVINSNTAGVQGLLLLAVAVLLGTVAIFALVPQEQRQRPSQKR